MYEQKWLDTHFNVSNLNVARNADAPMRGRTFSDSHKRNLSMARKRRICSPETRKKMSDTRKKLGIPKQFAPLKNEFHRMAKLSWSHVNDIRLEHTRGVTGRELAQKYNVGTTTISKIINNKSWVS